MHKRIGIGVLAAVWFAQAQPAPSVRLGENGRLAYEADARGNTIIDFSHAGYGGGGKSIPNVPARIYVEPGSGHHRERIQAAIDLVSAMPAGADGFRGAVLLGKGTFQIDTNIRITASGVVLRGSGSGDDGTVLVAMGASRRALLEVAGAGERKEVKDSRRAVADAYVAVGASTLNLRDATGLSAGDRIIVERPSTAEWIALLGMNTFQGWRAQERLHWLPGSRDIGWDRVVTAVKGNQITLDAPLTTALDGQYGGGSVYRYEFPGRLSQVGVENLRLVSAYDPARPMDEDHAWFAIGLDKVENAWVRRVAALHFASYVINAEADTKWLTVEDCEAADPVSELGGYRRRVFYTAGQLTLFQRAKSRRGRNDFATGFTAAGPNVFLDCSSTESFDYSGPLESWASGVLYDNVSIRGNALRLINRGETDQGSGWAAANSVLWNSEATDIEVTSPPSAYNRAYGSRGTVAGNGIANDPKANPYQDFYRGTPIPPRSLYLAQLNERLGAAATDRIAAHSIPASPDGIRRLSEAEVSALVEREAARAKSAGVKPLRVENGQFIIGGQRAMTKRVAFSFYQGQMPRKLAPKYGPAITRFAPGRTGLGLTDDLEELGASMAPGSAFTHHYGLWYDRRRVNHNFDGSAERRTGDVWAPFMELPWARSGQGKAWDGLSKYDLTRFNPWFFERVKQFADVCDRRGLILYHNFYLQHWLLETPAHYIDFPWRPFNTIQDTGLPDQNPAAGVFWDLGSPLRKDLHRRYIRKCLDNLKDNANVVYGIDREFTGPIEFLKFWLDEIAQWEKENGKRLYISLEVPKEQMDTLLEDPVRGPMVTAIGFHGWNYRPDGKLFAIQGNINKAPREQEANIIDEADLAALKQQVKDPAYQGPSLVYAPESVALVRKLRVGTRPLRYRAFREYRDRYPNLVIIGQEDEYPDLSRAVERAIPGAVRAGMRPAPLVRNHVESSWSMASPGKTYLVYSMAGHAVELDLAQDTDAYSVSWIDSSTGEAGKAAQPVKGGGVVTLAPPRVNTNRPWVAWLAKVQ